MVLLLLVCVRPAVADETLQGEVHDNNHPTRIKRPDMPALKPATAAVDGQKPGAGLKGLVDIGDFEFAHEMAKPDAGSTTCSITGNTTCGEQGPQLADTDDKELIIAWEQWHKRVAKALWNNWMRNSQGLVPGTAATKITITKNGAISLVVQDVNVQPDPEELLDEQASQQMFAARVVESVRALDRSALLEFPAKSRRPAVTINPNFETEFNAPPSYDWKHGDVERVPMN